MPELTGLSQNPGSFPMILMIVDSDGMPSVEPLEVLVPSSIEYNFKPRIKQYHTRGGIVQEHWGDELDELRISGATAPFIDPKCGYSRSRARETDSYAEFVALVEVYKNNGALYDAKGIIFERSTRGNPAGSTGGTVLLYYSVGLYEGYLVDFQYAEDAVKPYFFNFDFTFRSQRTVVVY